MPVYVGVLVHISFSTFLEIFDATEFNSSLELLELDIIGEVDYSLLPGDNPCILHELEKGRVFPVLHFFFHTKCLRRPKG